MQRLPSSESLVDEPISPTDPAPPRRPVRETPGTEFFSSVYLDSPRGHGTGTRPLRVRKRSTKIAGIGRAARRRRSTMSLPRTPRTPHSPASPASPASATRPQRTNTTSTSGSRVHHSISQIFFATSPMAMSPPLVPPKPRHVYSDSMASDFHLGLGRGSYDDSAVPGPSPPTTPALSPATRAFARKFLPPTPMTPSRAPPKAAKLLGTTAPDKHPKNKKVAKKDHYRPLPTQTMVDIDKFLGNVAHIPLKSKPKSKPVEEVGNGSTVRHRGEDGMMWMDVEEEVEFAWLLSDAGAVPSPLPEVDPNWGMEAFTSVLAMPRPTKDSFIDFDDSPVVPRRAPKVDMEVSPWSENLLIPPTRDASRPRLTRTDTSDSDASSSGSGRQRKAPPPPLKLRARQINPHLPVVSRTPETGKDYAISSRVVDKIAKPYGSKGVVNRFMQEKVGLAIVLNSVEGRNEHSTPDTPFVRPRRAPVPNAPLPPLPNKLPSHPAIPNKPTSRPTVPNKPGSRPTPLVFVPALESPRLIPYVPNPTPRMDAYDGHLSFSPDQPEEVSFFDPVTPTTTRHSHKRVIGGSGAVMGGGAWLKKMVSSRRGQGVRI